MKFHAIAINTIFAGIHIGCNLSGALANSDKWHPSECDQQEYWNKLEPDFQTFCLKDGWTEDDWEEGWDWYDLTVERQQYWTSKGLGQDAWEQKHSHWGQLTEKRQLYYEGLGISKDIWDRDYLSLDKWEKKYIYWDDLSEERKQYYKSQGIGKDEFEMSLEWDELTPAQQRFHESRGWTAEAWDNDDKSLLKIYNEEEMEWDELTQARREYWISRGWSQETWEANATEEEECPEKSTTMDKFEPIVLRLDIPELAVLDMEYLSNIDKKIGLKDGTTLSDNESFHGDEMSLKDYMSQMKQDETTLYFQLEDLDQYKDEFEAIVGNRIIDSLYSALIQTELRDKGHFRPEWNITDPNFDKDMLDWSLFVGSTNTTTAMHYDSDLFNFLWVVEGRKRVVMIPNTNETKGRYQLQSAYSGSGWTGIDILSRDYELPDDAVVVEIGAGEGLMFPYLCWHAVENLKPTVAYGLRVKED